MKNHDFMSHELKLPELTLRGVILGLFIMLTNTFLRWPVSKR